MNVYVHSSQQRHGAGLDSLLCRQGDRPREVMLQPLPHGAKGAGKVSDSGSSPLHLSPGQRPSEPAALGLVDKRCLKGLGGPRQAGDPVPEQHTP